MINKSTVPALLLLIAVVWVQGYYLAQAHNKPEVSSAITPGGKALSASDEKTSPFFADMDIFKKVTSEIADEKIASTKDESGAAWSSNDINKVMSENFWLSSPVVKKMVSAFWPNDKSIKDKSIDQSVNSSASQSGKLQEDAAKALTNESKTANDNSQHAVNIHQDK